MRYLFKVLASAISFYDLQCGSDKMIVSSILLANSEKKRLLSTQEASVDMSEVLQKIVWINMEVIVLQSKIWKKGFWNLVQP